MCKSIKIFSKSNKTLVGNLSTVTVNDDNDDHDDFKVCSAVSSNENLSILPTSVMWKWKYMPLIKMYTKQYHRTLFGGTRHLQVHLETRVLRLWHATTTKALKADNFAFCALNWLIAVVTCLPRNTVPSCRLHSTHRNRTACKTRSCTKALIWWSKDTRQYTYVVTCVVIMQKPNTSPLCSLSYDSIFCIQSCSVIRTDSAPAFRANSPMFNYN